jgi:exopolysaccharide production protein ExoZ
MRNEVHEHIAGRADVRTQGADAKYFRLQYLRAIAAFSVVVFHAAYHLKVIRGDDRILAIVPPNLGGFGVCLFFVISGYLMASLATKTSPSLFIVHRIIRIYPIYWLALGVFFVINRRLGHGFILDLPAIALLPGDHRNYALGVEWTLPFELSFYLIVFFVMLTRLPRILPAIAAAWAFIIIVLLYLRPDLQQGQFPRLASLLISEWTLPFVVGLLIPFSIARGLLGAWAVFPGLAFVFLICIEPNSGPLPLAAAGFFLVAWAVAPRAKAVDQDKFRTLTKFGDWSYALYLCHDPIIISSYRRLPPYLDNIMIFIAIIFFALCISSIFGRIDLALYGRLKILADKSARAPRYALGSAFAAAMLVFGAYGEVAAAKDRAALAFFDSLGKELSGSDAKASAEIETKAEADGLTRDPAFHGHVDQLSRDPDGAVRIAGWALDTQNPTADAAALIFYDGQYWGAALTRSRRPDVAAAFGNLSFFLTPGFDTTVGSAQCQPGGALVVIMATANRRFALLPAPATISNGCDQAALFQRSTEAN